MAHLVLGDGVPLWYEDLGAGPVLVLLPGLQFDSWFWQRNLPPLAAANRVLAVDPRGHGQSGKPMAGYTIAQVADDLAELFDRLDLRQVCLCGAAFGGLVALEFITRHGTGRLRSLALCEMTPRLVSAPGWAHPTFGGFPPEAAAAYGGQVRADRGVLAGFLDGAFGQPVDSADRAAMDAHCWLTPTAAVADYIDDMVTKDYRAMLAMVDLPLLAIYGRRANPVMPGDVGRWIAGTAPRGELAELADAGHSPFWDDPDAFNAALGGFAARH